MQSFDPASAAKRVQFRLRSLLALVAIAALACTLYATLLAEYRREKAIEGRLAGLQLEFTWQQIGPSWLWYMNALQRVVAVKSGAEEPTENQLTDANLEEVCELPYIRTLHLSGPGITDSGLFYLHKLTALNDLALPLATITDKGLQQLLVLRELEALDISFTGSAHGGRITAAGIAQLVSIPKLREIDLVGTDMTDRTLEKLAECPHLKGVAIDDGSVSRQVIEHVQRIRRDFTIFSN